MNIRTIISGIILTIGITAAAWLFGLSAVLFLIAGYNLFIAVMLIINRENYHKITKFMNPYKYEIYQTKDEEFRAMIKPDPIGYFVTAALFGYIGYKALNNPIAANAGIRLYILIAALVGVYYFVETMMLKKSESWKEYTKLTAYLALAVMAAAFLLI